MARSLVLSCLALLVLVGCPRRGEVSDAARSDAGPVDARLRTPESLYLECDRAIGCSGVDEVCFPIRRNGVETAWCSYVCGEAADCPGGLCLVASGTVDDRPRCHQECVTDADCSTAGFGCEHVGIMTTRGSYEADLCYPQ